VNILMAKELTASWS